MAGIFNRAIFNDAIFNTAAVRQTAGGKATKGRRRRRVIVDGKVYDVRTEYELQSLLTALVEHKPVPQKIAQRPIKQATPETPVEVIRLPDLKAFDWSVMRSRPVEMDPAIFHLLATIRARMEEEENDIEVLLLLH